jgi:cytochrome c oxidase accessory protein FixG
MRAMNGPTGEHIPVEFADEVERELYAKRNKIYPREVTGRFASLRTIAVWVLLGIYYVVPWLRWDDRQMVLFDLPARKFYILWFSFFPQDFLFLTFFLILCALSLFFFTSLAGRLWCGFACPQTVWTEVFMWIERKFEGDRARRQKLDKAPLTTRKFAIKAGKHAVWIVFALWTGFTFVGFFTPIGELAQRLAQFALGPWETFWVLFYAFATYGNAGWMREQVCIYMCPYARFQSAMFDRDTMIIAYDAGRGEPRGSRKRSVDHKARGLGDCIDCTMCVQVCPTGIDIRDGLQYQCIGCAACIDACDAVMDKMEYPRGLIRYTTENAVLGKPVRVLRTRTVIYGSALLLLSAGVLAAVLMRTPLALDVLRDRNALYRETAQGLIENVYTLKVINMDEREHRYRVEIAGLPGATLILEHDDVRVGAGEVLAVPARVRVDPYDLEHASSSLTFLVKALDDPDLGAHQVARFLGPARRAAR